ncbi:hypothetical protein [Sinanaerobacter sp. ZZT-01]|uniref:hypothetical protein n=1 Tax=Sinanaerobacter sp. ZZT-01 TaxID=3111540 RepID=UPI002D76C87F|nr:hypothetical protein [Sinanaerobacter sp. ZZT-01]WRR93010.1 hypothetical protein U5921_13365 [Sinanaerobacter sp. ZZT-01]
MNQYNNIFLGANVIESTSIFQTAVASILCTQADYLDTLLRRNESTRILMEANEQICQMISSIKFLEKSIVNEIEDGIEIRKQKQPDPIRYRAPF